jgi:sulfite reductase (NADPH) flavoprotein alpha-component
MNAPELIPVLPESAPFSPEQRAYLNGFLAGLFSRAPVPNCTAPAEGAPRPLRPLCILFGSQTGNCEALAKRTAKQSTQHGFAPIVQDLAKYSPAQLAAEENVLVLTSTYGDGDPPDNAKPFWDGLSQPTAPELKQTRFAVLALGDSNYPKFCGFGKALDARLGQLGAVRVHERCDCDVDFEEAFAAWAVAVLAALAAAPGENPFLAAGHNGKTESTAFAAAHDADARVPVYSRANPFPARLLETRPLCGSGSAKDVRHVEIGLEDSGLTYEAGDALGVFPTNDPCVVDEILRALGCDGEEAVAGKSGEIVPLRLALLSHYDIRRISTPLFQAFAEKTTNATLQRLAIPEANGELTQYLFGREVIDLLLEYPTAGFTSVEFVSLLKKLAPRLYSISSSPKRYPGQIHLTVGVLKYDAHGRCRRGVCSNFLAERLHPGTAVPVFVQVNKAFRPPAPDRPMVMVGPGTGIAPFRAFLQERRAMGAKGRNWLFFGDQHAATDFLYRDELEALQHEGTLHRLDTAFSRDQAEKLYVQHRMIENARELYAWLQEGAFFYVCGDASRMARDVDQALHKVIELSGQRTVDQAAEEVRQLQAQGRYQRDVY